ncbi:unnamed protein product [Plasmodium vivax]|uniref:Uncharacterized protein n=6 Tax=Plasmodium vivax TaxID=5855 RepID=A5KAL6_PLAVS|nr:hypothetical protein, conserved [Plasmodium vivax]KMZ82642.1 hypothetical protein PVIIG_02428 [Plasmodium vivax India VII]KMZ89036.1 hypothetical protein PVBG_03002 [Plasmodium vivax Brazil I]KMZ95447.1 hypothetical protein PVMG_04789 [Plasmodium vivax Mauritania I]KNA01926.1 hypothetical protein PVNG_02995 [Plasmodium vivax North Korean]EDL43615.1 hypothetical protein, conserved [Plasmodium vivax]|eukprot:XP_001613342.1 hypothetical protein [Plasmodium vivax Sal-1]
MKEYENLEILKKKFSPLLFIFRKDEENELKKYTKKCTLVNAIKHYKGQTPKEYGTSVESRSNLHTKNKIMSYFERPLGVFTKFYDNPIVLERGQFFRTNNMNRNGGLTYRHNNNSVLNRTLLNSKYFPNILNNNIVRMANDEESDFGDLEEEYVVVKKVYTYVREFDSMYMYIF